VLLLSKAAWYVQADGYYLSKSCCLVDDFLVVELPQAERSVHLPQVDMQNNSCLDDFRNKDRRLSVS